MFPIPANRYGGHDEFTLAQLQNLAQDETPTPVVMLTEIGQQDTFSGWGALAFDADGNLWVGGSTPGSPNLLRFSPQSIADGGFPEVALTVPIGWGGASLAFDPIPPGLPTQP